MVLQKIERIKIKKSLPKWWGKEVVRWARPQQNLPMIQSIGNIISLKLLIFFVNFEGL